MQVTVSKMLENKKNKVNIIVILILISLENHVIAAKGKVKDLISQGKRIERSSPNKNF